MNWHSIRVPESSPIAYWDGSRTYRVVLENDAKNQIDAYVTIFSTAKGFEYKKVGAYAPRKGAIFPIDPRDLESVRLQIQPEDLIQQVAPKDVYQARYLDLKGAPWKITTAPFEPLKLITVQASSGGYEGANLEARDLDELIKKIDDFSATRFRLAPNLQKSDIFKEPGQPFIGEYKDSFDTVWFLYDLRDASRGVPGFYGKTDILGDFRLVGPSSSLTQVSRDVKDFTNEKTVFGLASRTNTLTLDAEEPSAQPASSMQKKDEWYQNPWVWVLGGGGLLLTMGVIARATAPRPRLR